MNEGWRLFFCPAKSMIMESRGRVFATASHRCSWVLKSAGDAKSRPGRNDRSMRWVLDNAAVRRLGFCTADLEERPTCRSGPRSLALPAVRVGLPSNYPG
jgi:hypothetical protein